MLGVLYWCLGTAVIEMTSAEINLPSDRLCLLDPRGKSCIGTSLSTCQLPSILPQERSEHSPPPLHELIYDKSPRHTKASPSRRVMDSGLQSLTGVLDGCFASCDPCSISKRPFSGDNVVKAM